MTVCARMALTTMSTVAVASRPFISPLRPLRLVLPVPVSDCVTVRSSTTSASISSSSSSSSASSSSSLGVALRDTPGRMRLPSLSSCYFSSGCVGSTIRQDNRHRFSGLVGLSSIISSSRLLSTLASFHAHNGSSYDRSAPTQVRDSESSLVPGRELEGLLVVSLEQAVAAPLCSSRLADAGARVIKLERVGSGDFARTYDHMVKGQSAYFVWCNRGKQSLGVDIKNTDDIALVHRILSRADVFLQNLGPGATTRAGLGSAVLRQKYPRLITCDISGYGEDGVYSDMKAYDLLVQAETGLCSINGTVEPARIALSLCDISAGVTAHAAILQALIGRSITGLGRSIQVSLFHAVTEWMNVPYLQLVYGGKSPARLGIAHPSVSPYGAFPCNDGSVVVLSVQNEREFHRFASEVLCDPGLLQDDKWRDNIARVANRPLVDGTVASVIAQWNRQQTADRLKKADIAFGFLNSLSDLMRHPALSLSRVRVPVPCSTLSTSGTNTGAGFTREGRDTEPRYEEVNVISPGVSFDNEVRQELGDVPLVGQHTGAIRREFSQ